MAIPRTAAAAFACGSLYVASALASGAAASDATAPGEATYRGYCAECHTPDADGKTVDFAPAIGNARIWKYRMDLAGGREGLYNGAIRGIYNMLPKGGHSHLTDDQVRAAVDYILANSQ